MKRFIDLLKQKAEAGEFLTDEEKAAKNPLIDEIDKMFGDEMAGNMKKVTVMAPDEEGLEAGLEKAAEVVESGEIEEEAGELSKEEQIAKLRAELAILESEPAPEME